MALSPFTCHSFRRITEGMKISFAMILVAAAAFASAGCETDVAPAPPKPQLGRVPGQIVQPDRSEDPVIRENTRVGY